MSINVVKEPQLGTTVRAQLVAKSVDRHTPDSHVVRTANDAAGNLSAVGNEQSREAHSRNTP